MSLDDRLWWIANSNKAAWPGDKLYPEGWYISGRLAELVGGTPVVEIGCGPGRLAGGFDYDLYTGWDISPSAIDVARAAHPLHRFCIVSPDPDMWPAVLPGATALCYTLLLHLDDTEIEPFITRLCSEFDRVVVGEIMDRARRPMSPGHAYNRNASEYKALFRDRGFHCVSHEFQPYTRYEPCSQPILSLAVFARRCES